MNNSHSLAYNKDIISNKGVVAVIGVSFFILATMLGSYVRIPVPGSPVPITLQTLFVLLSGAVLGKRLGVFSQIGYMVLGALGVGVAGLAFLFGPTGGYIIGFAPAAFIVGLLLRGERPGLGRTILAFTVGSAVVYVSGMLWLVHVYGINLSNAISAGVLPFIPGDIAKIALSVLIYSNISARSREIFLA